MNKFTVRYPNGIKRHINKRELDLLGASLRKIGPKEYFASSLYRDLKEASGPNFLDLELIFERKGKQRDYEREQTPRGMIARLEQMGFVAPPEGFSEAAA